MGFRIEDGTGDGYEVKVTSAKKLSIDGTVQEKMATASEDDGDAYIFASGDFVTISSTGTETGFFYIKNTSATKHLHIHSVRTCGGNTNKWKLYKDVSTGTLISDQTAGSKNNLNLTSANVPDATVYKGANGKTLTDGTMLEHWINSTGHSTEFFQGALILGTNDTLALTVEVDASQEVCCRIIAYYEVT